MSRPGRLIASLSEVVGGSERGRVVVLLAGVLALSFADTATVGAVADPLERAFGITHAQLGLLAAASSLAGALATLPAGVLVDRMPRVRLLVVAVALWSAASLASAAAVSYPMLLVTRIGLGAAVGVASPAVASLTGDLFPAQERARAYGWILSGELLGAGLGFAVGGTAAGVLSWRAAFGWLALPGLALAAALLRAFPEPARDGRDRIPARAPAGGEAPDEDLLHTHVRREVEPDPDRILRRDPARLTLPQAVAFILRIPTNRLLIIASALGYFFFAGAQTFAVLMLRDRFGLGQATASGAVLLAGAGAVVGTLAGGRLADAWSRRGRLDARIVVAAGSYLAAAGLMVPALLIRSLAVALPLLILAVTALGAANPALDAARLDVVPGRLWGRAEGTRTLLRQLATAAAPVAFGLTADALAGGHAGAFAGAAARGDTHLTFLIMLATLVASGLILLTSRGGFPRDVATAEAASPDRPDDAADASQSPG